MCEPFPPIPDLQQCLRGLIAQVPRGRVTTCGDLADALGNRIAAKWVGHFALHHLHDDACTCHRIVRAGGLLGGYVTGDLSEKIARLTEEGIALRDERIDLNEFGFKSFRSESPLKELQAIQEKIQSQIDFRVWEQMPQWVAGVDVAYPTPEEANAAYALVETQTAQLVWSKTIRRRVTFPYISTYLSFRELPILIDLLNEVRQAGRLAELILVDGSGILHHRHAGIASHLGVIEAVPTVGVTKKLLCGQVDLQQMEPNESRPILFEGEPIGIAMCPKTGSRNPIFLSPGHYTDLAFAEQIVRRLLTEHRLPEPLYWADRLSRN